MDAFFYLKPLKKKRFSSSVTLQNSRISMPFGWNCEKLEKR